MSETISVVSADDPRVNDFRCLAESDGRQAMEAGGYFVSEGWMSIERLIESEHAFRSVLLSPSRVKRFGPFMERTELVGVPVFVAERDVMSAIVGFDLPRGVLMSADRSPAPSVDALAAYTRRLVVLDGLDDDESVGAIARAARAFGVDGMVLSPTCTDPYHRRVVRVSMGEILHMPVARATSSEWAGVLDTLHQRGFSTWAIQSSDAGDSTAESVSIWSLDAPDQLAILFGPDDHALDNHLTSHATTRVTVPAASAVAPLGAGQTAAIVLAAVSRHARR